MTEFLVDVVADQRLPASAAKGRMLGKIVLGQAVGEDQDRSTFVELADFAHRESRPRTVVAHEGVFVFRGWLKLGYRLVVETALQNFEARRARTALVLAWNPRKNFKLIGTGAAPKSRALGSVTDDDSTCHPAPTRTLARSPVCSGRTRESIRGPGHRWCLGHQTSYSSKPSTSRVQAEYKPSTTRA